jgi:hypothetical protein
MSNGYNLPPGVSTREIDNPCKPLGKRGFVTFATQHAAETYLVALPYPYAGQTLCTATGWAVSYRMTAEASHV